MTKYQNDNRSETACSAKPDAHGQAAYLLIESLIHGLIAQSTITLDAAIDIVDVATEVKVELGDSPETTPTSLRLLEGLAGSLRTDQTSLVTS